MLVLKSLSTLPSLSMRLEDSPKVNTVNLRSLTIMQSWLTTPPPRLPRTLFSPTWSLLWIVLFWVKLGFDEDRNCLLKVITLTETQQAVFCPRWAVCCAETGKNEKLSGLCTMKKGETGPQWGTPWCESPTKPPRLWSAKPCCSLEPCLGLYWCQWPTLRQKAMRMDGVFTVARSLVDIWGLPWAGSDLPLSPSHHTGVPTVTWAWES